MQTRFAALVVFALMFVNANSVYAQTAGQPILFVHGFCSDSSIWGSDVGTGSGLIGSMVNDPQLAQRFSSDGVTRLYASNGIVYHSKSVHELGEKSQDEFPNPSPNKRLFTVDFFDDATGQFGKQFVNDTGIVHKAAELAAVIKEVARISEASNVIVVAHSLGGLAARAYVQGLGSWDEMSLVSYANDVGLIVTLDTPHHGAEKAKTAEWLDFFPGCPFDEDSQDRTDLKPESVFLSALNNPQNHGTYIPDSVKVVAIASRPPLTETLLNPDYGDFVVRFSEQRLKTIAPYGDPSAPLQGNAPGYEYVWFDVLNEIADASCLTCVLHTSIYNLPQTHSIVKQLINGYDAPLRVVTAVAPGCVQQGYAFNIGGAHFAPFSIARVFARPSGSADWLALVDYIADGSGSFIPGPAIGTNAATDPGMWAVTSRDESLWLKGDLNGDGIVNSVDFSIMNQAWFATDALSDINRDGLVNSIDFSILSNNWFKIGRPGRMATTTFNITPNGSCP
jgi:pimeloyl-ACP methyl ester carboxylesterase